MRQLRYLAALAVFFMLGCAQDKDGAQPADVEMWEGELPVSEPWLRESLPDNALVYARIPDLFGMFATPKGNAFDPALRSSANVENIIAIREGLIANALPELDALIGQNVSTLQKYVRSPIEIAGTFIPAPTVLFAVTLDIDSNDELSAALSELGVSLLQPLDADNVGQIDGLGMPVFVRFDAATGQLLGQSGPGANPTAFAKAIEATKRSEPHRMRVLEGRIDESGQGLFVWMNAQEAMPLMRMFVPMDQMQTMIDLGLEKVAAVGMGWGVADGKGRLAIAADVPSEDDRGFIPYVENDLSAKSVGNPDALFVLSFPTADEFSRLEALALELSTPEQAAEWERDKAEVVEKTGLTLEQMFGAVGPELLLIFDEAGDYGAVRIRDEKTWNSMLESFAEAMGNGPDEKEVDGRTYYHWGLSVFTGELLMRPRDHIYWVQDGEFLYFAAIPQVLFDRMAMGPDTVVGDWLTNEQGIDGSSAVMSISSTSRKLPRRLYGFYVEMLNLLADVGQADIDVWSMPTAAQLGLPEEGTIGFTVSLGNPTLAAEFTFENNPAELLGSMSTVAVVGILAAIAIPAYEDYTTRAEISEGLSRSAAAKAVVTEYYVENGRFPPADAAAELSIPDVGGQYTRSVDVEPDTGVIEINYRDTVAGTGGQLFLEPMVGEDGQITWTCWGTFADKHLPAACRG